MFHISKWETAILLIATLFLSFTAGWLLRDGTVGKPIRVETQRRLEPSSDVIALPLPTEDLPATGGEKVNINTADADTLASLPGIGEKRAADIIADREANGFFRFPEDITRVKGIGEETLKQCGDWITVGDDT